MSTVLKRLYLFLLRLLPSDFAGDFGDAMRQGIVDADAHSLPFWCREIAGLVAAIVREHLDVLRQDTKYALRMMRRTPGFTLTAIVMLALGTGVNVAMFSVIDAVLLRSPFPDQGRLVQLTPTARENGETVTPTHERYAELAANPGMLAALAKQWGGPHVLTGVGDPRNVDGIECVSASIFDVLRTRPMLGRVFGPDEDRPGAAPVIVLSYDFWRELGGSPSLVGSTLTINQTPVSVIGVMPRGYNGALSRADTQGWVPFSRPLVGGGNRGCPVAGSVMQFGRVRPGPTLRDAEASLRGFSVRPLTAPTLDGARPALLILMAAVACVLLIACLNVGGLQMERTLSRRRELTLRVSLGASAWRVGRQVITENAILALAGGVAGIALARVTLTSLLAILPPNLPHLAEVEINLRVLLWALAIAGASGVVAGAMPLIEIRRLNPATALAGGGRMSESRQTWARHGLIVTEIALSIVVLIGAALLVQTFLILKPDHPGFDPAHKVTQDVRLRGESVDSARLFFPELLARVRAAPAVRAAAATTYVPMSGNTGITYITLNNKRGFVFGNLVTPGFFELFRIPMIAGRTFSEADSATSEPVIILNELLAQRIRPGGNLVGQRIAIGAIDARASAPDESRLVVGIAANMRNNGGDLRPRSEAWVPYAQSPGLSLTIVAESAGSDAEAALAVREAVRALRPNLVMNDVRTVQSVLDRDMVFARFGAWLLSIFAALAIGMAALGLFATIGWWVGQRTREVGVRMALGASPMRVRAFVLRQGLALTAAGVGAGLAGAAGLTRYLEGWIYGVSPLDTVTFVACAAGMLVVAGAAVLVPMRRATGVDPVTALRAE
jgi:putative ABC transport system permease protein